jgi:hypothetical protein
MAAKKMTSTSLVVAFDEQADTGMSPPLLRDGAPEEGEPHEDQGRDLVGARDGPVDDVARDHPGQHHHDLDGHDEDRGRRHAMGEDSLQRSPQADYLAAFSSSAYTRCK